MYLDKDIQLMVKVSAGDEEAYARLYKKYFSIIIDFLASIGCEAVISEDLSQEALIRVWENREKYLPTAKVKTFIFTFARNVFYEHIAKEKQQNIIYNTAEVKLALTTDIKNSYSININHDFMMKLEKLIDQLPDKQKKVCGMTYLGRASSKKIANKLECSLHSVHQSLYLARQNLHKCVSAEPEFMELGN